MVAGNGECCMDASRLAFLLQKRALCMAATVRVRGEFLNDLRWNRGPSIHPSILRNSAEDEYTVL